MPNSSETDSIGGYSGSMLASGRSASICWAPIPTAQQHQEDMSNILGSAARTMRAHFMIKYLFIIFFVSSKGRPNDGIEHCYEHRDGCVLKHLDVIPGITSNRSTFSHDGFAGFASGKARRSTPKSYAVGR